jgi:hypothetical protein
VPGSRATARTSRRPCSLPSKCTACGSASPAGGSTNTASPANETPVSSAASSTATTTRKSSPGRATLGTVTRSSAGGPGNTSIAGESGRNARTPSPSPSTAIQNREPRSA